MVAAISRDATVRMITDSDIEARAGSCCATHSRIDEMRLDTTYEKTVTRAGNDDLVRYNYIFYCLACWQYFCGYVVCGRMDWPPLAEFVDLKTAVPVGDMLKTFEKLTL